MALVWQKQVGDSRYEVRSHGATVRLYSNGVFHSQWNPDDPLKGSLWELLLLPVFFRPVQQVRRVLILGVGGGALIRLLQRFVAPEVIVGVDIDRHHLTVARRFFGVRDAELVCGDAREYVAELGAADGVEHFDLIVDDLFGHCGGVAERAIEADIPWCESLLKLLSQNGLVVSNFGSRKELLASGWRSSAVRAHLQGSWSAELPDYENCIGIFSRQPLSLSALNDRAPAAISPVSTRRRLDARLRPLR
ncbi:spermidine synthase [Microbulbifer hydrolyticus]|uniref:SAM-dependent methyltransferase n=1 Tax=Microbulbifer hydrolyticus TaxID=48074 RepID=A0A6P1TAX1_9GAMM|nr:class I SAM-dependent methyltransferase [Microbulbifer hydrolyticus]MBB5210615.1 SAM-dependent methyltransferase [Microbulbifer hydrolyticus]QHQ38921.1 class I SAM-dependent methyltransferase [Microbulbifer hydrolyticus]